MPNVPACDLMAEDNQIVRSTGRGAMYCNVQRPCKKMPDVRCLFTTMQQYDQSLPDVRRIVYGMREDHPASKDAHAYGNG